MSVDGDSPWRARKSENESVRPWICLLALARTHDGICVPGGFVRRIPVCSNILRRAQSFRCVNLESGEEVRVSCGETMPPGKTCASGKVLKLFKRRIRRTSEAGFMRIRLCELVRLYSGEGEGARALH